MTDASADKQSPRVEIRRNLIRSPQNPSAAAWTYELLNERQLRVAEEVRAGNPGALLLSEVAPVITVGRRTAGSDLLLNDTELAQNGISRCTVDRGGFATYHGPGQWVMFAVDRLDRLTGDSRGVRKAVEGLLSIAQKVAEKHGIGCSVKSGSELGVWTARGKFSAIGVQVSQGVLLHGIAINGFKTPQSFQGLRPCGLDTPVDYLLSSAHQEVLDPSSRLNSDFASLGEDMIQFAQQVFWK